MNVSRRQQGTFTSQRDVVYRIFEEYLKLKKGRAEWDAADRYISADIRRRLVDSDETFLIRVHKILHHQSIIHIPFEINKVQQRGLHFFFFYHHCSSK